jgi:hypothetical protein
MTFLGDLKPAEREAFTAVAVRRSFPRGSRLMSEGEPASHVMVIESGWTRITVRDGGLERTVVERGPGQIVGERGALRPNVRSATVTALVDVEALVMRAGDFASFISAHERVLEVVDEQIWDRLVEDPAYPARDALAGLPSLRSAGRELAAPAPAQQVDGENCTVLFTDVVGFGSGHRSDLHRQIIREEHLEMMRLTLGPLWESCFHQDRGDGLLIIVPPQVTTAKVMSCVNRELPDRLRLHNGIYAESARFDLRVSVNVGPVTGDRLGFSGEAIIRTSRLVEAAAFKNAMAGTGAALGIMVAPFVYETAIGRMGDFIYAAEYQQVEVVNKEFAGPAWMRLVDPAPQPRQPSAAAHSSAGEVF